MILTCRCNARVAAPNAGETKSAAHELGWIQVRGYWRCSRCAIADLGTIAGGGRLRDISPGYAVAIDAYQIAVDHNASPILCTALFELCRREAAAAEQALAPTSSPAHPANRSLEAHEA